MSQQVYVVGSRNNGIAYSPDRTAPGNDVTFQARICANEGTGADVTEEGDALKQADVSTISRTVYQQTSSAGEWTTIISGPTSLTVSNVISDTLSNGNEQWTLDSIGRNFADTVTVFDTANYVYGLRYKITLTSGSVIVLLYQHSTSGGPSDA